ncbi:hypothetical protein SDRG_03026 [Saprolegnia diclina VS20]|uniref:Uncharacterized protein n=1 Tax=Saprolegnia diclina (strain VS20) TaxID=1156394 RepID=T0S9Y4_SAPDV|nr:hypothetical protein SDRG_03026 [Saprolegnia diclina VS20]EQC39592.1 hypothetical protein SDRG_03026 [Saprolegnia diclina VS20]|eukprot:XP_008606864.1 hypothetical protein SDRG_03026 [Saprolegnia diclina VS20]
MVKSNDRPVTDWVDASPISMQATGMEAATRMEGSRLVDHVAARRRLSPWMRELVLLLASGDVTADVVLRTIDVEVATTVPLVPSTATSPVFIALQELLFASIGQRWAPELLWRGLVWPLTTTMVPPAVRKELQALIHAHGCTVLLPLLLSVLGALGISSAPPTSDDLDGLLETRANAHPLQWAIICAALPRSRQVQQQYRACYVAACDHTFHTVGEVQRYRYVGFDVDGTLVQYRTERILRDSLAAIARRLLLVYPTLQGVWPPRWLPALAQRSVAIDVDAGDFIVLGDDGSSILGAFHGSRELVDINNLRFSTLVYMHTLHDVVFAPLFAWLVDAVDSGHLSKASLTYASLASSVRLVAYQYNAQEFEPALVATPAKYIVVAKATAAIIKQLATRHTLFLITNGTWEHANHVLTFALGGAWEQHFALVVTEARKDSFFTSRQPTRPFQHLRPDGNRCPAPSPLPLSGRYCGGHASSLHAAFGVAPNQVAYAL